MKKQGYTLIEMLIGLQLAVILVMLASAMLYNARKMVKQNYHNEDLMALYQIRLLLVQSTQFSLIDDNLHFSYGGENYYLTFHNYRLVKRDGYEIYMQNLDDLWFEEKEGCYFLNYEREQVHKKTLLTCK